MPLRNLLANGFSGRVSIVNRSGEDMEGASVFRSIAEVPGPIDVAFIVLPAEQAPQAVEDVARAGARVCVIGSSGFAESGDASGLARQHRLRQIAQQTGMRIVGPNTNGVYNAIDGVSIGFNSTHAERVRRGRLAVISHSGGLFSSIRGRVESLGGGISYFIAAGNEADLDMTDYLEYLIGDRDTDVIACVIESLPNGNRFRRLAREAARRGQRVIALKVGESQIGQAATIAHSSRLAGSARAYRALFQQSSVSTVRTVEALAAAAIFLGTAPVRRGQGVAIVSASGAGGILLADQASRHDVPMAPLTRATLRGLDHYRRFAPVVNPIDLGATGAEFAPGIVELVAKDPTVGAIMCFHYQLQKARRNRLVVAEALARWHEATGKCVVVSAPGGIAMDEVQLLVDRGVPVFADTDVVMEALTSLFNHGVSTPTPRATLLADLPVDLLALPGPLPEHASREFLAAGGIPFSESVHMTSRQEALSWAAMHPMPLAVKGMVRGVEHKAQAGLVRLDVRGRVELGAAFDHMVTRAEALTCQFEGVLLQPMIPSGIEAIVGVTQEVGLGMFLVAGLGGIHADALDDVVLWHVPAARRDIEANLARTRLGRVLRGAASPSRAGFDHVVDILIRLQDIVRNSRGRVSAIDINPLIIHADGVVAVDALVVAEAHGTTARRRPKPDTMGSFEASRPGRH
jgi:acyl-CoA synthetase (NDP forming)